MQTEWFGEGVDLPFEGTMFRAPTKYDTILQIYYGDYMTPPPVEEQVFKHTDQIDFGDYVPRSIPWEQALGKNGDAPAQK